MKEEQNSRPLNAPTDGNGDREKKEREINMQVMERFIRFINTGDCGIGEGIISPNVVFYALHRPNRCMDLRVIRTFLT